MNSPLRPGFLNLFRPLMAFCAAGLLSGQEAPAERIARVESGLAPRVFAEGKPIRWTLQERMAHHRVPGVSIAVINEGKLEWARGYGTLEAGGSAPVNAETVFQAASISKPVSALALLRLVEAGKLQLDQDVNERLKTWKVPESTVAAGEKVTLRRMLSHSAGLTVHGFRGYAEGEAVPSLVQILDGAPPANSGAIRVDVKPGTIGRYSGGGFVVMHQLVRDLTDESFEAVLQASVLQPLGMTRSTFAQPLPAAWLANAARAHRGDGKPIAGNWHTYPELAPDGLWTTATDLARFAIELQRSLRGESNQVISQAMTRQMLTVQLGSMGLGIVVAGKDAGLRFEHGGANEGFRCHLVAYASGRGCVIMTNSDNGDRLVGEIERAIASEYDWPDYRPEARKSAAVDPAVLTGYAGTYRTPEGTGPILNVQVEEGVLVVDIDGSRVNLLAESAQRFRVVDFEALATFLTVGGKKALWAQNRLWLMSPTTANPPPSATPESEVRTAGRFLVLRNGPSWRRPADFEQVLRAGGREVEVRDSGAMGELELSRYSAIIVPGGQPANFYSDYVRHAARFDAFVVNGGTLLLELNGAERASLVMPRGVSMKLNGGIENTLLVPDHPVFRPFGPERVIRANFASHGYLANVPGDALVLAVESKGRELLQDRPTWVEYPHGKGRVIAACQCFHDQDRSGRGALMATVLDYTAAKAWLPGN